MPVSLMTAQKKIPELSLTLQNCNRNYWENEVTVG